MATEWVIVDDSDSGIIYTRSWVRTVTNGPNNSETVFENTAHTIPANVITPSTSPASFSYSFSGTRVAIYGDSALFNQSIAVPDVNTPIWECIIDNSAVANDAPYGAAFPIQTFCHKDDLQDDLHTLEFRVTSSGVGLAFDSLIYLPSAGRSLPEDTVAWVETTDPRIEYRGSGWQSFGQGMAVVNSNKAVDTPLPVGEPTFSMKYSGTSVTWYGLSKAAIEELEPEYKVTLPLLNPPNVVGFYQVDGGVLTSFVVDMAAQEVMPALNPYTTVLFRTTPIDAGTHNLTVFYDVGNSTLWPLTIDHLTIENAFTAGQSIPSASTVGTTNKSSKAVVVGGAVGGVLGGLLLVFFALFVLRRWRIEKRRRERNRRAVNLATNDIKLRPFTRIANPEEGKKVETTGAS